MPQRARDIDEIESTPSIFASGRAMGVQQLVVLPPMQLFTRHFFGIGTATVTNVIGRCPSSYFSFSLAMVFTARGS